MRRAVLRIGALLTLGVVSAWSPAGAQPLGGGPGQRPADRVADEPDLPMLRRIRDSLEPGTSDWAEATRRIASQLAEDCYTHPEAAVPTCREAATLYGEALDSGAAIARLDELLFDYGMVLSWLGEPAAGAAHWDRLTRELPDSPSRPLALLSLGEFLFNENADCVSARRYLGEAAAVDGFTGRFYALYLDAWCALNLGLAREALDLLVAALHAVETDRPGDQEARSQILRDLPFFYAGAGSPAAALELYQSIAPQETATLLARTAEILDDLGRAEDAATVRALAP